MRTVIRIRGRKVTKVNVNIVDMKERHGKEDDDQKHFDDASKDIET